MENVMHTATPHTEWQEKVRVVLAAFQKSVSQALPYWCNYICAS